MKIRNIFENVLKFGRDEDKALDALGNQLLGNLDGLMAACGPQMFFELLDDERLESVIWQARSRTSDEDEQDLVAIS